MKYLRRFLEFCQGFKLINRCPNCEVSFFKNGEGGLETVVYMVNGKESFSEEVTLCIKCLANSDLLNKEKIRIGLQKREYEKDVIRDSLDAVDKFLRGEIPYATWSESSK